MRAHRRVVRSAWAVSLSIAAVILLRAEVRVLQLLAVALFGAAMLILLAPLLSLVSGAIWSRGKSPGCTVREGDKGDERGGSGPVNGHP